MISKKFLEGLADSIEPTLLKVPEFKFKELSFMSEQLREKMLMELGIEWCDSLSINVKIWMRNKTFKKLMHTLELNEFELFDKILETQNELDETQVAYLSNIAWIKSLDNSEKFSGALELVLEEGYENFRAYKEVFDLDQDEIDLLLKIDKHKDVIKERDHKYDKGILERMANYYDDVSKGESN